MLWRTGQSAPAFSLPSGPSVEITSGSKDAAARIMLSLERNGFAVRCLDQPSGTADAVIVTEGLATGVAAARHWAVLQAAKQARRETGVTLLLQADDPASGLEGLSRTLRKEWPETQTYAWTLPSGSIHSAGDSIARALIAGAGDGELSETGELSVAEAGPPVAPPSAIVPPDQAVWLVTGGARGVTAACAIELARLSGGTVLLAGRSAETPWLPDVPEVEDLKALRGLLVSRSRDAGARVSPADIDRTARALLAGAEIRATLAAIRATGARAAYIPLDAGDSAAVNQTLADVQHTYGPITGWVHGAGVLADRLAADKTEAELRRVFAPKVDGLTNILAAIDPAQLRHAAFFSSAAAFFGNRGQSDYAMANALLASAGRSMASANAALRVKVFHWGPWAGGMVDAALAGHFEAQGIPLIPVDEGARIFANELLAGDPAQIELVVGQAWTTV